MNENIIRSIDTLLKKSQFETFTFESEKKKNKFCFDLMVKKDNSIFIIKVFNNIDNLKQSVIEDIKALSILLNSKPLLIGIKNRYSNLEDNTIYIREGLPFITINTLKNIIHLNLFPYILARRGGGVIFLDGALMKTVREQKSISRKEISEELGVTKRTVCAYENESIRPSQKVAQKILNILNDSSIFRKINLFDWNLKFNIKEKDSNEELNPFELHLQDIMEDIGISTYWYNKGQVPIELSIYSENKELSGFNKFYPLFSKVPGDKDKLDENNLKFIQMFTNLFEKQPIFIVNNNFKIPESLNIPFIKVKRLEKIDHEEDFIQFIQNIGQ